MEKVHDSLKLKENTIYCQLCQAMKLYILSKISDKCSDDGGGDGDGDDGDNDDGVENYDVDDD